MSIAKFRDWNSLVIFVLHSALPFHLPSFFSDSLFSSREQLPSEAGPILLQGDNTGASTSGITLLKWYAVVGACAAFVRPIRQSSQEELHSKIDPSVAFLPVVDRAPPDKS